MRNFYSIVKQAAQDSFPVSDEFGKMPCAALLYMRKFLLGYLCISTNLMLLKNIFNNSATFLRSESFYK